MMFHVISLFFSAEVIETTEEVIVDAEEVTLDVPDVSRQRVYYNSSVVYG